MTKKRGNGQGSVYKLPSGKYKAVIITGYYLDDQGRTRKHTRSAIFDLKKDAVSALPSLRESPRVRERKVTTFYEVYQAWLPTHRAGKSTIDCYKAAVRYFGPLFTLPFREIDVDDLQECIDDCGKGKRTKENMRAAAGLMYKYAIPRQMTSNSLNLAQYLSVSGESSVHRDAFTDLELARLWKGADTVPYAGDILIMCYTGFRPGEYLALTSEDYNTSAHTLTGGSKTEAGKGRVVTLSPKILPLVEHRARSGGFLCSDRGKQWDLKAFSERAFYPALDSCGISNPMVEVGGGVLRHRISPHSCRHTFATLIKRVGGADKDKLELIGHTSTEMLRHYQDISLEDLRVITDAI